MISQFYLLVSVFYTYPFFFLSNESSGYCLKRTTIFSCSCSSGSSVFTISSIISSTVSIISISAVTVLLSVLLIVLLVTLVVSVLVVVL